MFLYIQCLWVHSDSGTNPLSHVQSSSFVECAGAVLLLARGACYKEADDSAAFDFFFAGFVLFFSSSCIVFLKFVLKVRDLCEQAFLRG